MARGIITLLTDFGYRDTYVGQVKGVIAALVPDVTMIDLTHEVPPQDVDEGAFHLATAWTVFPPGTVHLAVVDPGVGSDRRALAVSFQGHYFVLPDNGLMTLVLAGKQPDAAVALDPARVSPTGQIAPTFHGRDLFAPAAAALARGTPPHVMGKSVDPSTIVRLPIEPATHSEQGVSGPVLSIDRFGTCRTLIRPSDVPVPVDHATIRCGSIVVRGIVPTFAAVEEGEPLALFGSHGGLGIALREGNAAEAGGIRRGSIVTVTGGAEG